MSLRRQFLAFAIIFLATPAVAETAKSPPPSLSQDIVQMQHAAGRGTRFCVPGGFILPTEIGRADFTIVLDDPPDSRHIITFSGDNGRRQEHLRTAGRPDAIDDKRPRIG